MEEIYILGVGNNTPVYIDLAELLGYKIKGLFHYDKSRIGEEVCSKPIIGSTEELFSRDNLSGENFALSMGNNEVRTKLARTIRLKGGNLPSLIHPTASVSKYAHIDEGVIVQANSTIQADAIIKRDSVISFNVGISHNVIIEEGCYIACQSIVGAYTHIHKHVLIGIGVTIISGKVARIMDNAIVGGGSVVTKPIGKGCVVKGNPAK